MISLQHFVFAVPPYYHAEAEEAEAAEARRKHAAAASPESESTQDDNDASIALQGSQSKKIKSRVVFLTPEQKQDVADCYKDREWLYNFRCEAYKDTVRKNKALEKKAARLGNTAQDLKTWIMSKKDLAVKILRQNTSVEPWRRILCSCSSRNHCSLVSIWLCVFHQWLQ